jgi:ribose-phosphate pyrophosphokinase
LKIVGGSAGRVLAVLIARKLGLNASEAEIKRFPDGEKYLRVDDDVTRQDVVVVQSIHHRSDDLLFEYFLLCDTIRGLGASRIIGVLPYFGYARQDSQFKPGEAVSFRTVAKLIEDVGTSELFSVDMHQHRVGRASDVFSIPVHNLTASPLLAEYVRSSTVLERPVVIGPDEESEQWAVAAAKVISADYDILEKKRLTPEKVQIMTRSLDVRGRDVLLIDDIISTGDTMVTASKMLKEQGARRVIIACTHPILAHDALARIYATGAEIVVGTDTVPSPISHVSVAPLIADAIMRSLRSSPTLLEYEADDRN